MKRIALILIIALAAVAAIAAPHRQGAARPHALANFLDLTDAQIAAAEPLRETLHDTIEPLREQQHANAEAMRAAIDANDATKAGELMIANHAIREQIKAAHDTFKTAFEALLTDEQKAKFAQFQERNERRRRPRD